MTADVTLDGDQLIATRYLDAAPVLVWEMFTTPDHLAAFWGGDHAIVPRDSVKVDLRVGGTFELETRGADGGSHPLRFSYEVIDAPGRLVLAEPSTGITTEIRLQPRGTGTTVVIKQRRLPPQLQTDEARSGLAAILDLLASVAEDRSDPRRGTT